MKRVHVAAAVIRGTDGRILIARRADSQHQGGLWEFPGGKVEDGEAVEVALARELHEELGIVVTAARPLIKVKHDYPDKQVLLDVWDVNGFSGEPHGAEGQPLAWVTARELPDYDFPEANQPIVAAARLPGQYLITPEGLEVPQMLRGIQKAIADGIKLVQLRAPNMYDPKYRDVAVDAVGLCAGKAQLMLKGPLEWLGDFPAAGWHLTSEQLRKYASKGRPFPRQRWLAASCHNAEELALAEQMGVDFVTLSPVQATQTHPDAVPLGWEQAQQLIEGFSKPVYLLGGVGAAEQEKAWQHGAQGVAGIRAFWPEL
ncbi:Nudix family hydrolase [Pseudomonas sp. BIGb0427]|uniref:Nudix family hydrolase n=1 Tax=unclassified Pseudomonas TaxID=196821 RepID=UPI0018A7AB82|nr:MULTISPECIES: Nudix family hydrolase [unclassified Pseudomonas]QPG63552.1 Nudix family hydrolase [Pseudomonas sp. BIGb0427]QVM97671.1 Nudix family hydrolase [Pseudomonas sp. SORT22]UVL55449.1 Nudix family hydrolase [Pseudomonas sp. B21-035]UVM66007.1 Nudix family hydrolase [Pseudomonas sp. B21-009]